MPFALNLLASSTPRDPDEYDDGNSSSSSASTRSSQTVRSSRSLTTSAARPRLGLQRASPTQPPPQITLARPDYLLPNSHNPSPVPSRSSSPLPIHYASPNASSSSYTSDADSEPTSPLLGLGNARRATWWNDDSRRWWLMRSRPEDTRRRRRHLRRESRYGLRTLKRQIRRLVRHPFFPKQPTSIILTFLIFTVFAILVTLLLMHILNPDKASLPWRTYCSIPYTSTAPPALTISPTDDPLTVQLPVGIDPVGPDSPLLNSSFPPSHLDTIPPAGVFLGVFSTDSAVERRMLIRSTWASHERSRFGAGEGDDGNGTSRTIVRFVLGKPRKDWVRRVQLEAESYNDIIELPISENMNSGKTHAFFTWASDNAWVPGPSSPGPRFSYSNHSTPAPPLANHDPSTAGHRNWVRPDYVVKADEDSFVMLAELEARLRVVLDDASSKNARHQMNARELQDIPFTFPAVHPYTHLASDEDSHASSNPPSQESEAWLSRSAAYSSAYATSSGHVSSYSLGGAARSDPLIYWGYLVKNRFMAGELYALSWSLVAWVANEPTLKSKTRGAEDKQTAKWVRLHPRAEEVHWAAERCWIYDHPRAGTVYSHGFLFPSEAARVRRSILSLLRPMKTYLTPAGSEEPTGLAGSGASTGPNSGLVTYALPSPFHTTTPSYSYSSVSQFGTHYVFPLETLSPAESIEALIEGSAMSLLFEGGPETAVQAWEHREGRRRRYEGRRVGGTVVVHFIKRNEWFLETALALLGGEEVLPGEEGADGDLAAINRHTETAARTRAGHLAMSKRRQLHGS